MAGEYTAINNAMANIYRLRDDKAQFMRDQPTARWFDVRGMAMKGLTYKYKLFTTPMTAVRRVKVGSSSEAEFPAARDIDHAEVSVAWTDLTEFQASVTYTGLARKKSESLEAAVYRIAEKYVNEAETDFAQQVNNAFHQDANCRMGYVGAKYAAGGGAYSQATSALLTVRGGSITQFYRGQILDILNADTSGSFRTGVVVNDVWPLTETPGGTAYGPAITVTIDATEKARISGAANLDGVAANDRLVLSTEGDSDGLNFQSFPTWFGTGALFGITRTTAGNGWMIPHRRDFTSGTSVSFDLEEHLGSTAEKLTNAVRFGRRRRASENKDLAMTGAAIMMTTPALAHEAARQGGDLLQYAMELPQEKNRQVFGRSGFDGVYWTSPSLGPLAFDSDPAATPDTLRIIEPSSWFYVFGHDGGMNTVEWLDKDGRKFHYGMGTNGRMINRLTGGALMRIALANDQPQANCQLSGIKSTND